MSKLIKIFGVVLILAIIIATVQYVRNGDKAYRPTTTESSNPVQQALESGVNANNQPDVARYKKLMADSCLANIPNPSDEMQNYCKCMSDKVVDTYGIYKVADMGLSMKQEQLETELTPLAVKCIEELGIKL